MNLPPDDYWPPGERGPLQRECGATFYAVALDHGGVYGAVEVSRDLDDLLTGPDPRPDSVILEFHARRRSPRVIRRWDGWRWVPESQE